MKKKGSKKEMKHSHVNVIDETAISNLRGPRKLGRNGTLRWEKEMQKKYYKIK
jgi:hypothetical protein